MMSYNEVIAYSLEHYNEGGDSVFECMSEKDYLEEIAEGVIFTKPYLLKRFHNWDSYVKEIQATAW